MSNFALHGAAILADGVWLDDHALLIEDGKIGAITPADNLPAALTIERLNGGYLLPGFIDTQVNGGGGVLFNDQPTAKGIASIAAAILLCTRTAAWSGSVPTRKRTMINVPDGCVIE